MRIKLLNHVHRPGSAVFVHALHTVASMAAQRYGNLSELDTHISEAVQVRPQLLPASANTPTQQPTTPQYASGDFKCVGDGSVCVGHVWRPATMLTTLFDSHN